MNKPLAIAGAAVLALSASFAAGRFSRPARVEKTQVTDTHVATHQENHTEQAQQQQASTTKAVAKNVRRVTKTHTVKEPTGAIVTDTTTETTDLTGTQEASQTNTASQATADTTSYAEVEQHAETTIITETRAASWRVAALAGVALSDPTKPQVFGAELSRRFGPFDLGGLVLRDSSIPVTREIDRWRFIASLGLELP